MHLKEFGNEAASRFGFRDLGAIEMDFERVKRGDSKVSFDSTTTHIRKLRRGILRYSGGNA